MSEPKNAGVKTLGIRLPDALHAQFTLVAQLDSMSLGDAAVKAVESYVEAKRSEPGFAERAQAALEEIEREAAARRGALQGLFGTTAPESGQANEDTSPAKSTRNRRSSSQE
jgi:hypothetical protein